MATIDDLNSISYKHIPIPFGENAQPGYINSISASLKTSDPNNKASWNVGFPPITMQPVNADGTGGKPPIGADMNGVLNSISSHLYKTQFGASYDWNNIIATSYGGYPAGAIVAYPVGSNENKTLYVSLANNNTSIPTSGNWKPMFNDYVIESGKSGSGSDITWYRLYNSGWCEQGGIVPMNTSNPRLGVKINLRIKTVLSAYITPCMANSGDDNDYGLSVGRGENFIYLHLFWNNAKKITNAGMSMTAIWEAKGYINS